MTDRYQGAVALFSRYRARRDDTVAGVRVKVDWAELARWKTCERKGDIHKRKTGSWKRKEKKDEESFTRSKLEAAGQWEAEKDRQGLARLVADGSDSSRIEMRVNA